MDTKTMKNKQKTYYRFNPEIKKLAKQFKQEENEKTSLECQLCQKVFISKYVKKQHLKQVHKINPETCGICSESFSHVKDLKIHLEIEHLNSQKYFEYQSQLLFKKKINKKYNGGSIINFNSNNTNNIINNNSNSNQSDINKIKMEQQQQNNSNNNNEQNELLYSKLNLLNNQSTSSYDIIQDSENHNQSVSEFSTFPNYSNSEIHYQLNSNKQNESEKPQENCEILEIEYQQIKNKVEQKQQEYNQRDNQLSFIQQQLNLLCNNKSQ